MGKLFGTDGVRGVANVDLTAELALALGRAGAAYLAGRGGAKRPRLLVGRDTRASGSMLEAALVAGAMSAGVDCVTAGALPTPAVAYLVKHGDFDAGAMISASHNPVDDNGIKFFSRDGFKLSDSAEAEIEADVESLRRGRDSLPRPRGGGVGKLFESPKEVDKYVDFLVQAFSGRLDGRRIVLDCGNGAASSVAPRVFRRLGADVVVLNAEPNGVNINVECGSTHPQVAIEAVRAHGADAGFSFDGDADRVIAVDETGAEVNGDHILAALGIDRLERGALPGKAVAATTYSNGGLKVALAAHGGSVVETPAGDRYVLERMLQEGLAVGGEQSGHVILLDHTTTGDGILTALALLDVASRRGARLSELRALMKPLPQTLRSVRTERKNEWAQSERIAEEIRAGEAELGPHGRVFVRASGTEPLVRVMVEGDDLGVVERVAERVAAAIARELG